MHACKQAKSITALKKKKISNRQYYAEEIAVKRPSSRSSKTFEIAGARPHAASTQQSVKHAVYSA